MYVFSFRIRNTLVGTHFTCTCSVLEIEMHFMCKCLILEIEMHLMCTCLVLEIEIHWWVLISCVRVQF